MTSVATSGVAWSTASRPCAPGPTEDQLRTYANLSTAIANAIDSGGSVPCILFPALFDRIERDTGGRPADHGEESLRRDLCAGCPVIGQCRTFVDSGIAVNGFVAGAWRLG